MTKSDGFMDDMEMRRRCDDANRDKSGSLCTSCGSPATYSAFGGRTYCMACWTNHLAGFREGRKVAAAGPSQGDMLPKSF